MSPRTWNSGVACRPIQPTQRSVATSPLRNLSSGSNSGLFLSRWTAVPGFLFPNLLSIPLKRDAARESPHYTLIQSHCSQKDMKNALLSLRIPTALMAAFFSIQAAHAAVTTWNATGGNWSIGNNWDTLAAPGIADDARFGNVGAGTSTTMDISRTINSLGYAQDNQALHTTIISSGQTLTINRTTTGDVLYIGSTSAAITATTLTPVAIQGTGATLSLGGTGDLVIRQGNSTAGAHMATLDLSALDNFTATIGRLLVGQATTGNAVNRPSGTFIF